MSKATPDRRDCITLMYVPGETGRIQRFSIPRVWIRRSVVALGIAALIGTGLTVDYVRARLALVELGRLRVETAEQRDQILSYSRQIEDISGDLDRIARLDRKLRVITNLDPAEALPLPGIGGLEGGLLEPHHFTSATSASRHRRMTDMFGKLRDAAGAEAESLEGLVQHLEKQTARLAGTPSIAPAKGWITSGFGYRSSPFTGGREFHKGLDIAGRMKTPVVAPADGEVTFAGKKRALGNAIFIRHGYGLQTIYGHLSEISVKAGAKVKRGQKIGLMGNTGRSTGPHLHYQVEVNNTPVNPQNYILD